MPKFQDLPSKDSRFGIRDLRHTCPHGYRWQYRRGLRFASTFKWPAGSRLLAILRMVPRAPPVEGLQHKCGDNRAHECADGIEQHVARSAGSLDITKMNTHQPTSAITDAMKNPQRFMAEIIVERNPGPVPGAAAFRVRPVLRGRTSPSLLMSF